MSKKYLMKVIAFAIILSLMISYLPVDYADVTAGGFVYDVDAEDGVHITGYEGNSFDIVIPQTIDGKQVVAIDEAAFKDRNIVYVTLPEGLKEIGDNAFAGNLIGTTSGGAITTTAAGITLPSTLKKIGDHAFFNNALETVDLANVEEVGTGAFSDNQLTSVNLGAVLKIDDYAFRDNALTAVDLAAVTSVGADAFANNSITTVAFGNVAKIGDSAFKGNKIASAELPTSITEFGTGVFYYNGDYVRVETDNPLIEDDTQDGAFGHYVNVTTVTVEHVDEATGDKLIDDVVLGDDLSVAADIIHRGVENTYYPPTIADYYVDSEIKYTPDSDPYTLTVTYKAVTGEVQLEVDPASVEINATVDEAFLRALITVAMDAAGNDIKDLVTITPATIDTSVAGEYSVTYQVTDQFGNTAAKNVTILVGMDWASYPVGNDWVLADFEYDNDAVTGFSAQGRAKYDGGNHDLVLPHINLDDMSVAITKVADNAFSTLKLGSISDTHNTIKEIGEYAFGAAAVGYNGKLCAIDLPVVTELKERAFYYMNASSVNLPKLQKVGEYAFRGGKATNLDLIFENVTEVAREAFDKFEANSLMFLKLKDIPERGFARVKLNSFSAPKVETVGQSAFYQSAISDVQLPLAKTFGDRVFSASTLHNIDFPLLETAGESVFSYMRYIEAIDLPKLKTVPKRAFYESSVIGRYDSDETNDGALIQVKLLNATIIEENAFIGFRGLQQVDPIDAPKLTHIEKEAFAGAYYSEGGKTKSIISVTLPEIEDIVIGAFRYHEGSPAYGGLVVIWANPDTPCLTKGNYIVNPSEDAADWVDADFIWLNDDVSTGKVLSLTNAGSSKLINRDFNLEFPPSVVEIGDNFLNSGKVRSLVGSNVEAIGDKAFYGLQAFASGNNIEKVDFPKLKAIGNSAFERVSFPHGKDGFSAATFSGLTTIGDAAFKHASFLYKDWKLEFPAVTSLGKEAFLRSNIQKVKMPLLTEVPEQAFYNTDLTEVDFPLVTTIGPRAFSGDRGLLQIALPEVLSIGQSAFYDTSIKTLTAPKLKTIGVDAFSNCALTVLDLPAVETIERGAFNYNELRRANVGTALTSLDNNAFSGWTDTDGSVYGTAEVHYPTEIFIAGGGNPNNLANSPNRHIINPVRVIVHYNYRPVGDTGAGTPIPDLPSREFIMQNGSFTSNALPVFGYTVEATSQTITIADNGTSPREITHYYNPYDSSIGASNGGVELTEAFVDPQPNDEYLCDNKWNTEVISISHGTNFSGYTASETGQLLIFFDPDYMFVDKDKIPVSYDENGLIKDYVIDYDQGLITINLKNLKGGGRFATEIPWKFRPHVTPIGQKFPVRQVFVDDQGRPMAANIGLEPVAKYKPMTISKQGYTINGNGRYARPTSGLGDDSNEFNVYSKRVYRAIETVGGEKRFIGNSDITYTFRAHHQRYIERAEITDILPLYKHVADDGTVTDQRANFDPLKNPAWTLDADGITLRYSANYDLPVTGIGSYVKLKLDFPNLQVDSKFQNEAKTYKLYPTGYTETGEDPIENTKSAFANYQLTEYQPPNYAHGVGFFKSPNDGSFYNTLEGRNLPFKYEISYRGNYNPTISELFDQKNIVITDHGLDDRLYFDSLEVKGTFGAMPFTVKAYQQMGTTADPSSDTVLYQREVTSAELPTDTSEKLMVQFPADKAQDIDYLRFELPDLARDAHNKTFNIYVVTKLKNPVALQTGDINYYNRAYVELDMVSEVKTQHYNSGNRTGRFRRLEVENLTIELYKWKSYRDSFIPPAPNEPLKQGYYTLSARAYINNGELPDYVDSSVAILNNFEVVDLLPIGVQLDENNGNPVRLGEKFLENPGAKYEIVHNYQATGQTAIVFTADTVDPFRKGFSATIYTQLKRRYAVPTQTNNAYMRFTNPLVKIVGTTVMGEEWVGQTGVKYGKASATFKVQVADETIAFLSIGVPEDGDAPGDVVEWHEDGTKTASESLFYYRMRVNNLTDVDRKNFSLVNVLPYLHDIDIQEENIGNGKRNNRGTDDNFVNSFDTTRPIVISGGGDGIQYNGSQFTVQYWNNDGVIDYEGKSADKVFDDKLTWSNSAAANTKAIRIVKNDGLLKAHSYIDVYIPMKAPLNDFTDFPLTNKKAFDSFVVRTSEGDTLQDTERYLEVDSVYNQMTSPYGSFSFIKQGIHYVKFGPQTAPKPLAGAKFGLFKNDGGTLVLLKTVVSAADGRVKFKNIEVNGQYIVKEISPPAGYEKSDSEYQLTGDAFKDWHDNHSNYDIVLADDEYFLNKRPQVVTIHGLKVNGSDHPLSDIRFSLKANDQVHNGYTQIARTDDTGAFKFSNLSGGKYTLKELMTTTGTGYTPIDDIIITVGMNTTTAEMMVSAEIDGSAYALTKDDTLGENHFVLNQKVVNEHLQVKMYKLGVPVGYADYSDGDPLYSTLLLSDMARLTGYTFEVWHGDYNDNAHNDKREVVSGADGSVIIDQLDANVLYSIKEKSGGQSYTLNPNTYQFKLDDAGVLHDQNGNRFIQNQLNIVNIKKEVRGRITITKRGEDNELIEGVKFGLYANDDTLIEEKLTDANGELQFNDVKLGIYKLREVATVAGYYPNKWQQQVIVNQVEATTDTYEGDVVIKHFHYDVVNKPIKVVLSVGSEFMRNVTPIKAEAHVSDNSGTAWRTIRRRPEQLANVYDYIVGSTVDIWEVDGAGNEIDDTRKTYLTDGHGDISFAGYLFKHDGRYRMQQQTTTDEYILNGKPVNLNIRDEKLTMVPADGNVIKKYINNITRRGTLSVSKYDALSGKSLAGVKFGLYKDTNADGKPQDGELMGTLVTDGTGYGMFNNLGIGTYMLKELSVPDGYVKLETVWLRELKAGHMRDSFVIRNPRQKIGVGLYKKTLEDGVEVPLKGVKFGLFKAGVSLADVRSGKAYPIQLAMTDATGRAYFYGKISKLELQSQNYVVYELETVEGYRLSDEQHNITKDRLNTLNVVELNSVMNYPIRKLPETGTHGALWFIFAAVALFSVQAIYRRKLKSEM